MKKCRTKKVLPRTWRLHAQCGAVFTASRRSSFRSTSPAAISPLLSESKRRLLEGHAGRLVLNRDLAFPEGVDPSAAAGRSSSGLALELHVPAPPDAEDLEPLVPERLGFRVFSGLVAPFSDERDRAFPNLVPCERLVRHAALPLVPFGLGAQQYRTTTVSLGLILAEPAQLPIPVRAAAGQRDAIDATRPAVALENVY
jgi:hypothetical protein